MASSMQSGHEQPLCNVCSTLDLESYFQRARHSRLDYTGRPGATPDAFKLGTFENLYRKSAQCRFCDLVVCAICNFRSWDAGTPQQIIAWAQRTQREMNLWLYSYRFGWDVFKGVRREAFRLGIARRTGTEDRAVKGDHIGDIQLFCGDALRITGSSVFHGRMVSADGFDVNLARFWLKSCEKNHTMYCGPETETLHRLRSARVIDVLNSCICSMPEDARYFALSYCWPVDDTFKLVRMNLEELQQVGSLASRMERLPVTIQDAIGFVRDLKERYLWIDSLCIVQDDEDDKKVQLNQMDRIYGSALVTLVCSPATMDPVKACGGLPCYRAGTRTYEQIVSEVQGLRLLVPFEAVISLLDPSRWSSRAWTYQELLLSKRLIFFTDTQIYFQCSIGIFCEDSVGENVMKEAYFCPGSNLWNPGRPYGNESTDSFIDSMYIASINSSPEELVYNYALHVDAYTLRDMSLSSDILNAFAGIQNAMQFSMKTRFLCGLPLRYIDKCLLWNSPCPCRPRELGSPSTSSDEFPSWSWAGWNGPVSMLSYLNVTAVRCEVIWYLVDRNGSLTRFRVDDWVGKAVFPQPGNKAVSTVSSAKSQMLSATHIVDKSHDEIISSTFLKPISLACWAAIASFRADGTAVSLDGISMNWKDRVNLKILDQDGRWVGSAVTDRTLSEELLHQKQTRALEFMLVSRSYLTRLVSNRDIRLFDTDAFEERNWCMLNVMMVERQGTDRVKRLTIGAIHEDAWVRAQPTPMLFKLE